MTPADSNAQQAARLKEQIKRLRVALCYGCGCKYPKARRGVHIVPPHDRPLAKYYERCLSDEAIYGR